MTTLGGFLAAATCFVLALFLGCSQAFSMSPPSDTPLPPTAPHFVDVGRLDASIAIDMRYAGEDNFVGTTVEGYLAAKCLLAEPAAEALVKVQQDLVKQALGLLIYDCYRPQRAVDHFVRWAQDLADVRTKARHYPAVDKSLLFELGYIAEKSGHSRGSTVDLTLVRRSAEGEMLLLAMGTDYDFFDPLSHTEVPDVSSAELENRLLLKEAMENGGFENYPQEWWHYTLKNEVYPDDYWDVPVQ